MRTKIKANISLGALRIHRELLELGIGLTRATVATYLVNPCNPPSQTWRMFLQNHFKKLLSVDFFVVPTLSFRILYMLLVLAHEQKRGAHFNAANHPAAEWNS